MTATPIPRTAVMTIYGDLEASILDELPPGRSPATTRWLLGDEDEAWSTSAQKLEPAGKLSSSRRLITAGSDVVDDDGLGPPPTADELEAAFDDGRLFASRSARSLDGYRGPQSTEAPAPAAGELAGARIGLLHGQLPGREKEALMTAFRDHRIDVLVATTVVEVGVDVPDRR